MAKKLTVTLTVACLLAFGLTTVMAQEKAEVTKKDEVKHAYVGESKCKICHKKDNTHPTWLETPHAKAFAALDEKHMADEKCLACHATGKDDKAVLLEGVQCEACHGPGADYKKKTVMEDRELAIANGLVIPNEKTCVKCHQEKLPTECGEVAKFDFAKMKAEGVHAIPEKK